MSLSLPSGAISRHTDNGREKHYKEHLPASHLKAIDHSKPDS